jgi:hypothetical protein
MSNEKKLDFSAISFDDVIGDGAEGLSVSEDPQNVEDSNVEVQEDPVSDELDADIEVSKDDSEDVEYSPDQESDEEIEEDISEEGQASSVALEIAETLGLEIDNNYADTVEGLTEFVKDMSQEVAETQIEDLFQQHPLVQQHLDYVLAGGDSEKFFEAYNPNLDYNNFQINEGDHGVQKAVLSQYFQAKGHEPEFIQELLEDYQDSGKLYAKSESARQALGNAQEAQRSSMLEEQQEQYAKLQEEETSFWEEVAEVIETGNEFAGVRIPETDKADFFDYISAPINKEGQTQRDLDYTEADVNVKLAIDYLMFGGFKLDEIINTKARTKSVQGLKDRIVRNEAQVKNARGAQRSKSKTFDPDQLDINALF